MFRKLFFCLFLLIMFCENIGADSAWKFRLGGSSKDQAGNTTNKIRFARSMGYDYVTLSSGEANVGTVWQDANPSGLKFYIMDPHHFDSLYYDTTSDIYDSVAGTYTQARKDWIQANMIIGTSANSFPYNLASGWYYNSDRHETVWCFQQQQVIDSVIDGIVSEIQAIATSTFTCAGYVLDVPRLHGDMHFWNGAATVQTTIATYTGSNTCSGHPGTETHQFNSVEDGKAQFYIQFNNTLRNLYGTNNIHSIAEPWVISSSSHTTTDEYVNRANVNQYASQLRFDQYLSESPSVNFIQTAGNFTGTLSVQYSEVGSCQSQRLEESANRYYACLCGTTAASYIFDMHFNGASSIATLGSRGQLIRWIPNQDNLILVDTNGDLLSTATTRFVGNDNGTISYHSVDTNEGSRTNSYISNKIYWGRDHRNSDRTIYVCFLANSNMGTVTFPANDGVVRVWSVNNYYEKNADITSQFTLTNNVLQPISTFSVDTGSGTGVIIETGQKGRMYLEGGVMTSQ